MAQGPLGFDHMDGESSAAKSAAKAPGDRREGEAIVAYPSRIFPLEDRVVNRGAVGCWRDFMSGIDFLTRSVLAPCEAGDR